MPDGPKVVTYRDELQPAFEALNLDWIERYFWVEEIDREVLENPRRTIVEPGGEVFFVLEDDGAVGTCAMLLHEPRVYELTKMAVDASARGKGYGKTLMEACIEWARARNARRIFLESNTVLETAIRLYERYGFVTTRLGQGDEYERSNIRMELEL